MTKNITSVQEFLVEYAVTPEEAASSIDELGGQFKDLDLNGLVHDSEAHLDFLLERANKGNKLEKERLRRILYKVQLFGVYFHELLGYMAMIPESDDRDTAVARLLSLYACAIQGETKAYLSDPIANQFVLSNQARRARNSRSANPRELKLTSAIQAALGGAAVSQPHKQAESILGDVNRQLRDAGFGEVKVDVVRRRLEKQTAHRERAGKTLE